MDILPFLPEEILRAIEPPVAGAYPLSKRLVTKLPMIVITDREMVKSKCCIICMENFTGDDEVTVLPCFHLFHFGCIKTWLLRRSGSCPCCRTVVNRRYNMKLCRKMLQRALLQIIRVYARLMSELDPTGFNLTQPEGTREVVSDNYESSSEEEDERSLSHDRNGTYTNRRRVTRYKRRREYYRAERISSESAQVVTPTSPVSSVFEQAEVVSSDANVAGSGAELQNEFTNVKVSVGTNAVGDINENENDVVEKELEGDIGNDSIESEIMDNDDEEVTTMDYSEPV